MHAKATLNFFFLVPMLFPKQVTDRILTDDLGTPAADNMTRDMFSSYIETWIKIVVSRIIDTQAGNEPMDVSEELLMKDLEGETSASGPNVSFADVKIALRGSL